MGKHSSTEKKENHRERYHRLDEMRGLCLISMILYHGCWDLCYMFQQEMPWFQTKYAWIWQQSICWGFILLAGFCWSLGRHKWSRNGLVFFCGLIITGVTCAFLPQDRVIFGVLTFLGSAGLLMIGLDPLLRRCPSGIGCLLSFFLFLFTKSMNKGWVGIAGQFAIAVPKICYRNMATAFLGFPPAGFFSTDYFSLIPWLFLFAVGYFAFRWGKEKNLLKHLSQESCSPLGWLGKHSLVLYMVHQPVLAVVLSIIFSIL